MGGRITAIALVAAALASGVARAGGLHAHGNSDPWAAPDARDGGAMQVGGPHGMPMYGPPPQAGMAPAFAPGYHDPTAVVPAGGGMPAPPMYGGPPQYGGPVPYGAPHEHGGLPHEYCPPGEEAWVGACDDPAADAGVQAILTDYFAGTYMRADFLLYEFEDPGTQILGAPSPGVRDVLQPFTVFSVGPNPVPIGIATVPTTADIFFKDQYGARLTWGRPVAGGVLEMSVLATEETDEQRVLLPLPPNQRLNNPFGLPVLFGNTTLLNGVEGPNIQLYDQSYTLNYSSRLWGAGGRLILPGRDTGAHSLKGTIGWRYFSLQESLIQRGEYTLTNGGLPGPLQQSLLRADAYNNVFGMEFGFQYEVRFWKFAFGVEPAVMLGPNFYAIRTSTDQFVSTTDPFRSVTERDYQLSPVLEMGAYARFQLRENAELRVGYDALWFTQVQRPAEGIVFDIDSNTNTSLVRPEKDISEMLIDGLNVSVIVYFP